MHDEDDDNPPTHAERLFGTIMEQYTEGMSADEMQTKIDLTLKGENDEVREEVHSLLRTVGLLAANK